MFSGGLSFSILDAAKATVKLIIAPTAPKALGSIPKNQFLAISPKKAVPLINIMPSCWKIYNKVQPIPANIPAIAARLPIDLAKIPIINAGNIDEAARPKANATVPAANPGGFKPR